MWQLAGWQPWDMERVLLTEYVAAMTAIRDMRAG